MIRLRRCNHLHVIAQASIHAPHGRDILVIAVSRSITVSIHAPTRGATLEYGFSVISYLVSIHAPTRGATAQGAVALFAGEFQSTRPHGARRLLPFSIVFISMRFNPRAHTGRDQSKIIAILSRCMFQSTRPHGARLCGSLVFEVWDVSIHAPTRGATPPFQRDALSPWSFNPRAHTRRDASPL